MTTHKSAPQLRCSCRFEGAIGAPWVSTSFILDHFYRGLSKYNM